MEDEKDRFGEKIRLLERAREDIYFAAKDRELIEKLKARLKRVERSGKENQPLVCPRCQGALESYSFMEFFLDRCPSCGGLWLDRGELEGILREAARSPLASLIDQFIGRDKRARREGNDPRQEQEEVQHGLQKAGGC